jgi:hypothetical protein
MAIELPDLATDEGACSQDAKGPRTRRRAWAGPAMPDGLLKPCVAPPWAENRELLPKRPPGRR